MNSDGMGDRKVSDKVDRLLASQGMKRDAESLVRLHQALIPLEVYYRATVNEVDGEQRITAPLLRLDDGSHALMVYTSKTHPELPERFAGAPWRQVLRMAHEMQNTDWLIVKSESGEWYPIGKDEIEQLLAGPTQDESLQQGSAATGPFLGQDDAIEAIITTAAADGEESFDALISVLKNRELFLRLAPRPSADGRPVIVTSRVGDVTGLAQAYTSRRRPGMTYGGMKWEAIVEMVLKSAEMAGVHIINDNDDWVVLDRSAITRVMG
ncbi:MAG: hypothetical protein ACXWDD_11795 [Aeromicrobium sp.]